MGKDPTVPDPTEEQTVKATVTAPVLVVPPAKLPEPAQVGDKNIAPQTTAEEDTSTAGQRHINRIWEYTQATLAIIVTCATLWVSGSLALSSKGHEAAFLLLSNAFFSVITFYLTRTNHSNIGGVKPGDKGR